MSMGTGSYHFKVGDLDCIALADGTRGYPPELFFANVSRTQVKEALRQHGLPTDQVTTPYTYLYVQAGERRVLVDMGAGRLAETTGRLIEHMRAAGIDPLDVDTVFITHAHPDHVGGTLDAAGQPVYSHARYYIWKDEWEFWTSEAAFGRASERMVTAARTALEPIRDRLTLLDREGEVVPGIGVLAAPGHTPGHMVVTVSSAGEQLMYVGDTVLHHLHLEHTGWTPIFDIIPEQAAASKRRIFDLAAETQAWVMGQHFIPFPSLGHVVKQGAGWLWQPVVTDPDRAG